MRKQTTRQALWQQLLCGLSLTGAAAMLFSLDCSAQLSETSRSDPGDAPLIKTIPGYRAQEATPQSEEGRRLFQKLTCLNCHSIGNKGGCLGPPLDGEGGIRNEEFLLARLTNTQAARTTFSRLYNAQPELLPHPRFAPAKAGLLVSYIKTLPPPEAGFIIAPHLPASQSEQPAENPLFVANKETPSSLDGRRLYSDAGCAACHAIGKVGGWFGPRLDGVGGRHSRSYIVAHITDAQLHLRMTSKDPEETTSRMPHISLKKDEIQHIADFLMTLPSQP